MTENFKKNYELNKASVFTIGACVCSMKALTNLDLNSYSVISYRLDSSEVMKFS